VRANCTVEFKHARFQDISRHEVTRFPQLFLWAKDSKEVYIEEEPRPEEHRYEDVQILFYGVGLGITILLMYLGLNPILDLLMFRSTLMRRNLPRSTSIKL